MVVRRVEVQKPGVRVENCSNSTKDFISTVRSISCRFLRAQSTWKLESKNYKHSNGFVYCYPSRSAVYTVVGRGPAAFECYLWKWVWLAKNCARIKILCRLRVRAELSYSSTFFGSTAWITREMSQIKECGNDRPPTWTSLTAIRHRLLMTGHNDASVRSQLTARRACGRCADHSDMRVSDHFPFCLMGTAVLGTLLAGPDKS